MNEFAMGRALCAQLLALTGAGKSLHDLQTWQGADADRFKIAQLASMRGVDVGRFQPLAEIMGQREMNLRETVATYLIWEELCNDRLRSDPHCHHNLLVMVAEGIAFELGTRFKSAE